MAIFSGVSWRRRWWWCRRGERESEGRGSVVVLLGEMVDWVDWTAGRGLVPQRARCLLHCVRRPNLPLGLLETRRTGSPLASMGADAHAA